MGIEMALDSPDLLFVPAQALPALLPGRRPAVVTTIHDLAFFRRPDLYPAAEARRQRSAARRAARLADRILVPSEATARDVVDFLGVSENQVSVIPLAPALPAAIMPFVPGRPYFLMMGRIERKKNVETALRAFASAKRVLGEHELHLAGPDGYGAGEIMRLAGDLGIAHAVRRLGYLDDVELAARLAGADALVFPSWEEGFGLPVLEAMRAGTPVIASDLPVHREVAGEAALLVGPSDPDGLAEAMRRAVTDQSRRATLIASGQAHAQGYSWQATAQATWDALRTTLG